MAEETPMTPEGAVTQPEEMAMTRPKLDEPPRLVKVNGEDRSRPGCGLYGEWGEYGLKHAIVYFLDNLLAGNFDELPAPHIVFGPITLKLRRHVGCDGEYIAYGEPMNDERPDWFVGRTRKLRFEVELLSSSGVDVLEYNLRKFALNKSWRVLAVFFGPARTLRIWKKEDGGYGLETYGLPKTEEEWNWHPHS
ncbi:MAG: hypothetical protein Q7R85_00075 [bacterium]|nr:hypothetical protein [bacterium]